MSIECLKCSEDNNDNAEFCKNCGASLKSSEPPRDPDVIWRITCPVCGKAYEVADENAVVDSCTFCVDEFDRREISKTKPIKLQKKIASVDDSTVKCGDLDGGMPVVSLHEIRVDKKISFSQDVVIGRMGTIENEFFKNDPYVSEVHCRVFYENNEWKVEHLSFCNPTAINGIELGNGIPLCLRNGDNLRIADLFFKVSIKKSVSADSPLCNPGTDTKKSYNNKPPEEKWRIICPRCGRAYYGISDEFRIRECSGCADEFDKLEICNVKPVKVEDRNAD